MDGRSPATSAHGPKLVAAPHVPMTWCGVCPVAAPSVRVVPEIEQVSQLAPGLEQELAPGRGGGKTAVCVRPTWANQPARMAQKRKRAIRVGACLIFACSNDLVRGLPGGRAERQGRTGDRAG